MTERHLLLVNEVPGRPYSLSLFNSIEATEVIGCVSELIDHHLILDEASLNQRLHPEFRRRLMESRAVFTTM